MIKLIDKRSKWVHKILILSDSHIFGSREQELVGVNTYQSLEKVTRHIRESGESYDLMVASGDLSEDGQTKSYEDFYELTVGLGISTVWMKGNHDRFDNVPDALGASLIQPEMKLDPWRIIFLDTTLAGKDEGELSDKELGRLKLFLEASKSGFALIVMHHQPVDMDSDFIDVLGLGNKLAFWETTKRYSHIKGVIFGHVHQEFDGYFNGIRLLSTPATSMQFKPFAHDLEFDAPSHGYRTVTLNGDGSMDTKLIRIGAGI